VSCGRGESVLGLWRGEKPRSETTLQHSRVVDCRRVPSSPSSLALACVPGELILT
jgi:hypothetical protein